MRRHLAIAAAACAALLALPAAAQPQPDLGTEEQRQHGRQVYDKWCGQCHGAAGDGQGIATPYLLPEPRDFTSGKYKFRSTPFGTLPTEEDLVRSIRVGLPGTGMPGFPELSERQVTDVIHYLKTFSDDWQDPNAYAEPVELPEPPPFSAERAEAGFETYVGIGCARCHGEEGRGDGSSAPTLRDDWGDFIRAADLTMPWTFRGGATREDIFRTLTTGIYGTPMAAFGDALTEEERWAIVDWIVARGGGEGADAPWGRLVRARKVEGGVVIPDDPAEVRTPFADAPGVLFPVVGQIMEPGRAFHPAVQAVEVRAIYDRDTIAFLVSWHDMSAETGGENRPDVAVPVFAQRREGGDALDPTDGAAAAGEELAPAEEDDVWGIGGGEGGTGFESLAAEPAVPESPWSDAVALQFPAELRPGVAKPYFLFGDASYPVELWHTDLARPDVATVYEGRGSGSLTPFGVDEPRVSAHYADGRWSVAFVRPRTPASGIGFPEDEFVPLLVSVWDGFHEERGNMRGLTSWYHVHVPPLEEESPLGSMVRAGLGVLGLELLLVAWVRRRQRRAEEGRPPAGSQETEPREAEPQAS